MTLLLSIAIPLAVLYGLFLVWYGGNGQPLSQTEIERFMREINAYVRSEKDSAVAVVLALSGTVIYLLAR